MGLAKPTLAEQIDRDGFAVKANVVADRVIERLKVAIAQLPDGEEVRRRGATFGIRNLLQICEEVRMLAISAELRSVVEPVLGLEAFAVRATLFDKVPQANWKLFWHQDSVITVKAPVEVDGFGGFARKAGVWHVQPTPDVLDAMLAVRVHLDECDDENGPLRVIPGSHRTGWIEEDLADWKRDVSAVTCLVGAGGVVLMRPLLLHASLEAKRPHHRRVIHLEYAAEPLPGGLQWAEQLLPPGGTQST